MGVLSSLFHPIKHCISQVSEGPALNLGLTTVFLANVAFTLIGLAYKDPTALLIFGVCMAVVYVFSLVIYSGFHRFALYLNENVFTYGVNVRAFDDKRRLHKWCDQGWQLFLHTVSSALEFPTLYSEGLLTEFARVWQPCPVEQTAPRLLVSAYMFHLAGYTFTGFAHRFFSVRRKDYYVMFAHHIATCILVIFSYLGGSYRVGLVVMWLHDFSDIPVDITQLFNHAHMEGGQFYFMCEFFFMIMITGWFTSRLWYLPCVVIKGILIDGHSLCAQKFPGQVWKYPKCEGIPFFHGGAILLSVLVVMHAYWFYLFFLIAIKTLTTNETDKGKIYETDLDEVEQEKAKKLKSIEAKKVR
jgi:ceramide synthetase